MTADGIEVAFVSLDRWPEPQTNPMVVYEIYIQKDRRRKGIGTGVLSEIENLAIREGFTKLRLRPSPLDRETSESELVNWYLRHGYKWAATTSNEMEKELHCDE